MAYTLLDRAKNSLVLQDEKAPGKRRLVSALSPLHYEAKPGDWQPVNATLTPVVRGTWPGDETFAGWMVTRNGWHYAISHEGWVGFGGQAGARWFWFRVAGVGWWNDPDNTPDLAKDWTALVEGAPRFDIDSLTFTTRAHVINGQTYTYASVIEWRKLWTTPNGGEIYLQFTVDGNRLKANYVLDKAAREFAEAAADKLTALGVRFETDWRDVDRVALDGRAAAKDSDLKAENAGLRLLDADEALWAFLPLDEVYAGDGLDRRGTGLKLRAWVEDGANHLLVYAAVDAVRALPPGAWYFDPTITPGVAAGADDGTVIDTISAYDATSTQLGIGRYSGAYGTHFYTRFDGIALDGTETIDSATMAVVADATSAYTFATNIYAVDEDDATAPTSYADFNSRSLTSPVNWTQEAWTAGTAYDTSDIATLVTAIITRGGWSTNNAIVFYVKNNGAPAGVKLAGSYENTSRTEPILTIDYTAAASEAEATATIRIPVGLTATATVAVQAAATIPVPVGLTATATVAVQAAATIPIPVGLTATATVSDGPTATATIRIPVGLTATAAVAVQATATIPIPVGLTATATVAAAAASATATIPIPVGLTATATVTGVSDPYADWEILVDWDGDGDFSEDYEDITGYVRNASWSLGMKKPFQSLADKAECTLLVNNQDARFTPENGASPYVNEMLPGRLMEINCTYASVSRTMWRGFLESVQPFGATKRQPDAEIKGTDLKSFAQRRMVSGALMEGVTADVALRALFAQVQPPPGVWTGNWVLGKAGFSELGETTTLADADDFYNFETGSVTFAYVGDKWADGVDAYRAALDLVAAERGRLFTGRDGKLIFWNNQHMPLLYTPDATLDNDMVDLTYAYGRDITNVVRVETTPRKVTAAATLWELDDEATIEAGETKTIRANYKDDSAADIGGKDVATPSAADGTLVADGSVTIDITEKARGADIDITNTGTSEATISTLILKGTKITSFKKTEVVERDEDSIAVYGEMEDTLSTGLLSDDAFAGQVARYELVRRAQPRGVVYDVTLQNRDIATASKMLGLTVGSLINVVEDVLYHDADYVVIGEQHNLSEGAKKHTVKLYLEAGDAAAYWLLGRTGRGELGEMTLLGL